MKLEEAIAEVRKAWGVYGDRLDYINEVYRKLLEASVVLADHASQQGVQADEDTECRCDKPSYLLGPCVNCGGICPAA